MPSQQQSNYTPAEIRDSWRTPPFVFHYLDHLFKFDVDLASDHENHLCETYFTKKYNALNYDWYRVGTVGWLNPPYSDQQPWIDKAIKQAHLGFTTVMLLPVFNGQTWWKDVFIYGQVMPVIGRLSFLAGMDYTRNGRLIKKGQLVSGNTTGSCIVVFGNREPLENLSYLNRDTMREWYENNIKT